jgi:hypothetical protein
MDNADLINKVLELTLANECEDATAEDRMRLAQLLLSNPEAICWYLRYVADSLTLQVAASKPAAPPNRISCDFQYMGEPRHMAAEDTGIKQGIKCSCA